MGKYYKLKDDGAKWRCLTCGELFSNTRVIWMPPIADKNGEVLGCIMCLDCVDEEWLSSAECAGSK